MSLRISAVVLFGALKLLEATECKNFDSLGNTTTCYVNVMWAKETGIVESPNKYNNFPFLNASSTLNDFQYVLSVKKEVDVGDQEGTCPSPCNMSEEAEAYEKHRQDEIHNDFGMTTAAPEGIKWWGWVLIVMAVICCLPLLGLACSALICYEAAAEDPRGPLICYEAISWIFGGGEKRGPKSSKRSVKPTKAAEAAAAPVPVVSTPMTSFLVAPPVYVSSPTYATSSIARTQTYMQTQMQTPAYMSAPVAQPVSYVTTAQPYLYSGASAQR